MAGVHDLILTSSVDLTGANRDLANFARNAPPVKIRVDSSALGAFSKNSSEFQKSLQASSARVLAFSLTASQVFGVVRAFQAVTKATIDVEKSLAEVNTILGLSQKQLQGFSKDLFKVANETGNSFKIAADGAVELSRQGLSAVETLKRLKDALTLTRLSGLSVQDSISAITTAINGFNDAALDSTAIINKLANVDAQFAVSSKDLADALARVGSTAKDTGVQFDELLGLVTAARQITGREGSVIGNSLKTIFQRIERPEVLDNLRELGVLVEDYAGKTLSARQILENLGKTYNTLSQAQKNQVVQLSAGVFQANQFRAILSDLAKQNSITARATDAASSATDQASRRQAELNKTLSANINETLNNLTLLASKVGTITLEPVLRQITGSINGLAGTLSKSGDEAGAGLGQTLGEGILKGIGNYLAGPGLALGSVLLVKLFGSFANFTGRSLAQILEVGTGKAAQEAAINKLIQDRTGLDSQIAQINASNLSIKDKELKIQQAINSELVKSMALANQRANIFAAVGKNITNTNFINPVSNLFQTQRSLIRNDEQLQLNPRRRAAVGFIPSLQESIGAIKGGYRPGSIKETHIPDIGKVIYNSAETVKKFPGFSQPAIIPPQSSKAGVNYNKNFIKAHGFSPYKSDGLIPNFAGFKTSHGSKYILNELGQTSRTKLSAGRGQGQTYPHYPAAYVSEQASIQILEALQGGGRLKMFEISNRGYTPIRPDSSSSFIGKNIGIGVLDRKTGQFIVGGPAYTEPKIGRVPVEISYKDDEKTYHIGHPISEIFNNGLIPNFMPQISKAQAAQLLKSKQFQSITYQKQNGELGIYNAAQYRVRRDKLVGEKPPEGFKSWTDFDEATSSLVLHSLKQGEKEAKFRRFNIDGIKSIRAGGEKYDVFNNGLIPNYARGLNIGGLFDSGGTVSGSILKSLQGYGGNNVIDFAKALQRLRAKEFLNDYEKAFPGDFKKYQKLINQPDIQELVKQNQIVHLDGTPLPFFHSSDKSQFNKFAGPTYFSPDIKPLLSIYTRKSLFSGLLKGKHLSIGPQINKGQGSSYGTSGNDIVDRIARKSLDSIVVGNHKYSPFFEAFTAPENFLQYGSFSTSNSYNIRNRMMALGLGYSRGLVPNYAKNLDIFRGLKFYTDSFIPDLEKFQKPAELGHGFIGSASSLINTLLYSITNATKPGVIPFSLSRSVAENQFAKGNAEDHQLIGKSGFIIKSSIPIDNILKTKSQINELLDTANRNNRQERGLNLDTEYNYANTFDGISKLGNFSVSRGLLFDEAKKLVTNRQSYVSLTDLKDYLREEKEVPLIGNRINNATVERLYNKGLIPNFNSLSSAIAREKAAGVPVSQIRVGSSPRIQGPSNPLGLGVYNTKDEPLGLNQGIQRYANMGLDPKRAGIPNYATGDLFSSTFGVSKTDQLNIGDLRQLNEDVNKYRALIRQGLSNQTDINRSIKNLTQTYKLNDESVQRITKSFTALYSPVVAQQKRLQERQRQLAGLDIALIPNVGFPLTKTQGPIQGQLFGGFGGNQLEFSSVLQQVQQPRITATAFPTLGPGREQFDYEQALKRFARREELTKQKPFLALNRLNQSSYLSGTKEDFLGQLRSVSQAGRGLPEELRQKFQEQLRNFAKEGIKQFTTQSFFNETSKLGFKDIFLPGRFNRLEKEANATGQQATFEQARQRLQGKALNASFILPVAGGILENGITGEGDSLSRRGLGRLAGGATNIASFTATGFGIGGPIGAGVGAGVGLISELPSIFKAFTDTLPDLERNLVKLTEASTQSSNSIAGFINSTDRLDDIYSGRNKGVTNFQVSQLRREQAIGLAGVPGIENRNKLRELFSSGNLQGAREFGVNVAQISEQRKRIQELQISFKNSLKEFNKRESKIENTEEIIERVRRIYAPTTGPEELNKILEFTRQDVGGRVNTQINDPRRIKDLQQLSSQFTSNLFSLSSTIPNNKGEFTDLFSAITQRQLSTPKNSIAAIKDVVPRITSIENFVDVLKEVGDAANIDKVALDILIKTFQESSKTIQEEIVKNLSPESLKQQLEDSEKFIASTIRGNKILSDFTSKLVQSQIAFDKFGQKLDINAIKRLGNLTADLRGGEIVQRTSNQIQLLQTGNNPFIQNKLGFEEEQLKNNNDLKLGLIELSNNAKKSIFDVISNTRETILGDLKKALDDKKGTLTEEDRRNKTNKLTALSKFFDNDPELLKIKVLLDRPQELTDNDVSKVRQFFDSRRKLFEKFSQIGEQSPLSLDLLAKQSGSNLSEFFTTDNGKKFAKESGLLDSKGELNEVGKFLSQSNVKPEELSRILQERGTQFTAYFKALEDFVKIIEENTKQKTRIGVDFQTKNKLSRTQFEQTQRVLPLQFRFNEDIANQVRAQNIGAARGDESGKIGNIDFKSALFTPLEYNQNTFWRDMATNLQDFSGEFKSSFQQGFREAITGAKSFGDAMRSIGLNIASNILGKASDLSVNVLFGALTKSLGFNGGNSILGKANGGLIPKYARGGYVDMGSGLRDDVPALLTGGEFVLNKKATRRIGKQNLDALNFGTRQPDEFIKSPINSFSGAITSDSTNISGNSAIIKLANSFELSKNGRKGNFNTSSLLSSFALTDENNPQNRLKFSREQYIRERKQFDKQVKKARSKFEQQQLTSLIGAYVSAGINIAGAAGGRGTTSSQNLDNAPAGTTFSPLFNQAYAPGYGPGAPFIEPSFTYRKNGGYIPRFANGGFFGGDSSSDKYRANIMGGEYVASPKTVQKYGVNYFENLNKNYAGGGYVQSNSNNDNYDILNRIAIANESIRDLLNNQDISKNTNRNVANQTSSAPINNININVTVDSNGKVNTDKTTVSQDKETNNTNDRDRAVQLSNAIKSEVIRVINDQSRSGGILAEKFQSRR